MVLGTQESRNGIQIHVFSCFPEFLILSPPLTRLESSTTSAPFAFFRGYLILRSADLPCASKPSTSANFFRAGKAFFSAARSYSTTLVRRWNWSTVRPAKDAPAPPVGNV